MASGSKEYILKSVLSGILLVLLCGTFACTTSVRARDNNACLNWQKANQYQVLTNANVYSKNIESPVINKSTFIDTSKRMLVFAPHPDDETLACGGLINSMIRGGNEVYIVFMTDGRNSYLKFGTRENPTPMEMANIRKNEAVAATNVLGVPRNNLYFLEFEDRALTQYISQAEEKVKSIVLTLKPTEIYYPDKYDGHPDHSATYEIVEHAISTVSLDPHKYTYIIHSKNNNTEITQGYKVSINIAENLPTKIMAIEQYKSQTIKLYATQSKPVLSTEFVKRFEQPEEIFFSLE